MLSCPICLDSVFCSGFEEINLICPPCGHIYHNDCLAAWMNGSNSCPKCRITFDADDIRKLYFTVSQGSSTDAADTVILMEELDKKNEQIANLKDVIKSVRDEATSTRERLQYFRQEYENLRGTNNSLREEHTRLMRSCENLTMQLHHKIQLMAASETKLANLMWIKDLINMPYGDAQYESRLNNSDRDSLKVALYHFKRETKKLTDLCLHKDRTIRELSEDNRDLVNKYRKLDLDMKNQSTLMTALARINQDPTQSLFRSEGNPCKKIRVEAKDITTHKSNTETTVVETWPFSHLVPKHNPGLRKPSTPLDSGDTPTAPEERNAEHVSPPTGTKPKTPIKPKRKKSTYKVVSSRRAIQKPS